MTRNDERGLMSFADLDLTVYMKTELSGRRKIEGEISLPNRSKATMDGIMYMATLTTDDNPRMGRGALRRMEMQRGRKNQQVKERIKHIYVTNKRVVETDAFKENHEALQCGLRRLGEALRMTVMKLKRRGSTWPTAKEAGSLPKPTYRETAMWLQLAPLRIRAKYA